jgi:hypothetical protein
MGRTVPSFRMLLEGIIGELSDFRRALRGEDRSAFDSLMNKAREPSEPCEPGLREGKSGCNRDLVITTISSL